MSCSHNHFWAPESSSWPSLESFGITQPPPWVTSYHDDLAVGCCDVGDHDDHRDASNFKVRVRLLLLGNARALKCHLLLPSWNLRGIIIPHSWWWTDTHLSLINCCSICNRCNGIPLCSLINVLCWFQDASPLVSCHHAPRSPPLLPQLQTQGTSGIRENVSRVQHFA